MGIVMANQRAVSVKHIMEFKETLRVLFISTLFVMLAARLTADDVKYVTNFASLGFLLVIFFIARPLSVFISTLWSDLNFKEKVFLSWMAPRGIVAAAVSSVFALRLSQAGLPEAVHLIDLTFLVITATVVVYGLTAFPLAKKLGIANPNPQGVLIVGAHAWARNIAAFLHENGYQVSPVDSNWANVSSARQDGLKAYYENVVLEDVSQDIDLDGLGKLLALTPNDEVNSLAALRFIEFFGRSNVYQLPRQTKFRTVSEQTIPKHLSGRLLFSSDATYGNIARRFSQGAVLKKTPLTEEFTYKSFKERYGDKAMPMFLIRENGDLVPFAQDNVPTPIAGQQLVALVKNDTEEGKEG